MDKDKFERLSIDELKELFKEYLSYQDLEQSTRNTRLSSAFYLYDKIGFDLKDLLLSDNFKDETKYHLTNTLKKYSKSTNISNEVNHYYSHMKQLREFILNKEIHNTKEQVQRVSTKYLKVNIPTPNNEQVNLYLNNWNQLENYTAQEKALNKLFWDLYKYNNDIDDVLAKVAILNDFYSTNIFDTYTVAKHIVDLDIDERLSQGDLTLVKDIACVEIKSKSKYLYSFATKYCSHHYEEKYPIFDSYVRKVLVYFRNKDSFACFKEKELKNYQMFYEVLNEFKKFYNLKNFSLKEIDKYLWLLGKEYLPNNYNKKNR